MKKTFIIALAIVLNLGGSAYASESPSFRGEAWITPGNILYKLDRAIETIRLNLTKDEEKKAVLLQEYAKERIGESEKVLDDKKYDVAEGLIEEANTDLKDALEIVDNGSVDGDKVDNVDNVSTSTVGEVKNNESIDTINNNIKSSLEVLESIKEKLPEQSKEKVESIIEFQKAKEEYIANKKVLLKELQSDREKVNQLEKSIKEAQKNGEDTSSFEQQLAAAKATVGAKRVELKELKNNMPKMKDFKSEDKKDNKIENKKEESNEVNNSEDSNDIKASNEDKKTDKVETNQSKSEQEINNVSNIEQKTENTKKNENTEEKKQQIREEKKKENNNGEKSNREEKANENKAEKESKGN